VPGGFDVALRIGGSSVAENRRRVEDYRHAVGHQGSDPG
jgi:uncharacterized protein (DUF1499 family)